MTYSSGNWPTARDQQHVARVRGTNMVQRTCHARYKIPVIWHTFGAGHAVHPLPEAIAQQAKVTAVHLGGCGLFKLVGMNSSDHCRAVVFVQSRPLLCLQLPAQAVANTREGVDLALQGTC